jgi:HEPN domain-containing protein
MTPAVKSLILKAQDNLNTARRHIDDNAQHDVVGYNLAQATEYFLKALCTLREVEYPHDDDGHDLDALMQLLEEDNMSAISSLADVVELQPYNSLRSYIRPEARLNLYEYLGHVEDLKTLVGQHAL